MAGSWFTSNVCCVLHRCVTFENVFHFRLSNFFLLFGVFFFQSNKTTDEFCISAIDRVPGLSFIRGVIKSYTALKDIFTEKSCAGWRHLWSNKNNDEKTRDHDVILLLRPRYHSS